MKTPHPFQFELQPTHRSEVRQCPSCHRLERMTVMAAEARSPLALKSETVFSCPRCERLSIPAGVVKRVVGLLLVVPFLLMIAGALATAGWMVVTMVSAREIDGGFVVIALVLSGAAVLAGRPALRTMNRLLRPGALLPLQLRQTGDHDFSGEL